MTPDHTRDRERFHQIADAKGPAWSEFAAEAASLVDTVNTGLRLAADRSIKAAARAVHVVVAKDALRRLEAGVEAAGGARLTDLERVREQLDYFEGLLCGRPTLALQ